MKKSGKMKSDAKRASFHGDRKLSGRMQMDMKVDRPISKKKSAGGPAVKYFRAYAKAEPDVVTRTASDLMNALGLPQSQTSIVEKRVALAGAIRERIEDLELTQEQAADRADVGRTQITGIVNGDIAKVSIEKLIAIAEALGEKVTITVG